MFSKKIHIDVKKSISKIQDSKKDSATRFKHLKLILENVDASEAKGLFEANFSHVYHILYDIFIQAETNLKQRVHKAHKEELEMALWLLYRVLTLLPDLLHKRWQLHSLKRLLSKLLHPNNSCKLRREALRYFLLWYQSLGENSPDSIHSMYASLVPGIPNQPNNQKSSVTVASRPSSHSSVFHDTNIQNPITPVEITPLLPPSSGEKPPDNLSRFYLEALLEFMVSTVVHLDWHDGLPRQHKSFQFLLEQFKVYYLPYICPNFNYETSLYKPKLELPVLRKPEAETELLPCRVALIKWVAHYTHVTKKPAEGASTTSQQTSIISSTQDEENNTEGRRVTYTHHDSAHPSLDSNISITHPTDPITEEQMAASIVREVLYSCRENVNFVHEVYRQAFFLNFTHSVAIRKAIAVYKDLIQMNVPELPNYMLEPLDGTKDDNRDILKCDEELTAETYRQTRLRNDSYLDAIHREKLYVRAGLQNVLRIFMTHAAGVFLAQVPAHCPSPIEEQTDACKRVLNIYRYMVMHTRMDNQTWEQLLLVLLQITSLVLSENPPKKKAQTLGGKLAPAIFQTLIVTWIKANLNVVISRDLWDRFLHVLTSLTQWEELIKEWAKTMDTLTRVLARHVYGLDLTDLPLDRLSEQKTKKNRRGNFKSTSSVPDGNICTSGDANAPCSSKQEECNNAESLLSRFGSGMRRSVRPGNLSRSYSETNLNSRSRSKHKHSHRYRHHYVTNISVLPSTIEQQINRLISQPQASFNSRSLRKAASLDSLPRIRFHVDRMISGTGDDSPDNRSRSPSPAPSSGVESNSIKDSPMQIDMLGGDGGSLETAGSGGGAAALGSSLESSGVVCGGTVRGWLPDVAVILWRRMLAALGDPNQLTDPHLHACMFEYLVKLTDTLIKISHNQGVSLDNMSTPHPPELVPPLTLIVPWCLGALSLPPEKYHAGRLSAHRLLATITEHCSPNHRQHITYWFPELHRGLCGNDRATLDVIIRYLGPRFLSLNLPGYTLLLLDLIHGCSIVLNSSEISSNAPRTEAVSILGGMLSLPPAVATLPVLQPNPSVFNVMTCPDLKEHVVSILLRVGRREPTGVARCIALSSLGMFIYRELANNSNHPKVKDAISVLLLALKFNNKIIAQVSSDNLHLLCDHADRLSKYYPHLPNKIVSTLAATLMHLIPSQQSALPTSEKDKSLITSLLLCLGEWCMRLGPSKLLERNEYGDNKEKSLLLSVFQVLYQMTIGIGGNVDKGLTQPSLQDDFDPNILVDNLNASQSSSPPNSPSKSQQCNSAVKLCAKMVLTHLVTHLGHFPMAIGAGRLSSLVVENDDVPELNSDELSAQIFTAANMQLFMFNKNTLASLIQLPALELPGGGITAGLITAAKQVRVLLRDLSGKASWDVSILYRSPDHVNPLLSSGIRALAFESVVPHDSYITLAGTVGGGPISVMPSDSLLISNSSHALLPQLGLRHRPPDVLPDTANAAPDLDQLDDLLQYLGHTSPECLQRPESRLNEPAPPPFALQQEQEVMSSVHSQRNAEMEYVSQTRHWTNMQPQIASRPNATIKHSPFQHCRLLFSQLSLTGWERRKQCHLLARNEKLLRELRNLDSQRCRETHKVAVIYVAAGQEDKTSILSNTCGSQAFENFISSLAWEVELESHTGFLGGLQRQGTNGETAPYYATSFLEVIFHVSTRMPSDTQEGILNKTRHLGNDEIHIVWSEHSREYRRGIIPTEFCDVLIVIYPLCQRLCRITINRKQDVPYFGPLFDEAIVETTVLAGLVRATAISASRAKRSMLPFYQQYYEERARSLDAVVNKHKAPTTFEEFAAKVYSPIPTVSPCCPVASNSGSCSRSVSSQSTCSSAPSSTLAAALLDHSHTHRVTLRQHTEHKFHTRASDSSRGVWFTTTNESSNNSDSSDIALHHGISPRPFKKLSNTFKNVPRRTFSKQETNVQSDTPPESPILPPRKGKN